MTMQCYDTVLVHGNNSFEAGCVVTTHNSLCKRMAQTAAHLDVRQFQLEFAQCKF